MLVLVPMVMVIASLGVLVAVAVGLGRHKLPVVGMQLSRPGTVCPDCMSPHFHVTPIR